MLTKKHSFNALAFETCYLKKMELFYKTYITDQVTKFISRRKPAAKLSVLNEK